MHLLYNQNSMHIKLCSIISEHTTQTLGHKITIFLEAIIASNSTHPSYKMHYIPSIVMGYFCYPVLLEVGFSIFFNTIYRPDNGQKPVSNNLLVCYENQKRLPRRWLGGFIELYLNKNSDCITPWMAILFI